ncbi:44041_t:CDS:1, partial [Gigaspora margarita]
VELEFMECSLDEDDEPDKIMVDICYFPLIGTNLVHDEKYQVITKASVVHTDAPISIFVDNTISKVALFSNN